MSKMDGPGITAVSVGIVFLYGGVKGYSPVVAFENIIKGKNPNEGQNSVAGSLVASDPTQPNSGIGTINSSGTSVSAVQATAIALAKQMGHADWTTGQQWSDWVSLWNQESGWNYTATNQTSGAYGIPQALPASKMASAGADWRTNPATQIKWGIEYIAQRYGSPANAWAHEQANNWY